MKKGGMMFSYGSAIVDGVALVGNRAERYTVTAEFDVSAHDGFVFDGIGIASESEYTKELRLHLWSAGIGTPSKGVRVTVSPGIDSYPDDLDLPIAVAIARLCGARTKDRLKKSKFFVDYNAPVDAVFCGRLVKVGDSYGEVMHRVSGNVARVLAANTEPLVTNCDDEFMPRMHCATLVRCEKLREIFEEVNESVLDHAVRCSFDRFGSVVVDSSDDKDGIILDMIQSTVSRAMRSLPYERANNTGYAKAMSIAGCSDKDAAAMYSEGIRPNSSMFMDDFQRGDMLINLALCAGGSLTLFDADEASDELLQIISGDVPDRQYAPIPRVTVFVCNTHDGAKRIAEKLGVQPVRGEDIYKMHFYGTGDSE